MRLRCPEVRIETTNKCNANCSICARESLTRELTTLPMGLFADVVSQAYELGATHVGLYGFGEPLLDMDLEKKIAMCRQYGLKTIVTTNASLLNNRRAETLIFNGLSIIRFSVHALTATNYGRIHRGLDFGLVMQNIFSFLEANDRVGQPCQTHMSVIPMADEALEDIRGLWEKNVDFLEVWKPHNWVDTHHHRKTHWNPLKRKKTCGRPENGPLQINADGTVMVCCFDFDGKMTVGNARTNTLQGILKNDAFELIREKHRQGKLKGLPCENCDQLNIGDSPLLWSNTGGPGLTSITKFKLGE